MSRRTLPLFACVSVFIAAGGVFLFSGTVTVLSITNASLGSCVSYRIDPSEQITLSYTNSMYGAPVEEIFEVLDGDLVLKAVKTDAPAVMEYYGFEDQGPVKALHRRLGPTLLIRTGMWQGQGFRIGGRTVERRALGPQGSLTLVSVDRVSQARFLWWRLLRKERPSASSNP